MRCLTQRIERRTAYHAFMNMNNNTLKQTNRASSTHSSKRHTGGGQRHFTRAASHVKVLGRAHGGVTDERTSHSADAPIFTGFTEDGGQTSQRELPPVEMPVDFELESLGTLLRTLRERRGMSIDELAREAHIAAAYVRALEEEDYRVFPARVYAEGFFKRVAHMLIPEAAEQCMTVLRERWEREMGTGGDVTVMPPPRVPHRIFFTVTPRRIMFGIAGVFFAVVTGFLAMRLISFLRPPWISLESPTEAAIVSTPLVRVKGQVNWEGRLTVNNREVRIDESGNFDEDIEVRVGANTLLFVAENKFGRRAEVVRHIVVR